MIHTKQGSFDNSNDDDQSIDAFKKKFFSKHPIAEPYRNMIDFRMIGKTVSWDDSKLPVEISNTIRRAEGMKLRQS